MPEDNGGNGGGEDTFDAASWQAALKEAGLDSPEKLKELAGKAGKADEWKGHARTWEQRAKENAGKLQEGATDAEKAAAAARAEGEKAAATRLGVRLARAEWLSQAANLVADPADLVEEIRLGEFVKDDGEIDEAAIKKSVERWARLAPADGIANPARGPRGGGNSDRDMNALIRQAAGRG
jgi:hypothetical protein